MSDIIRNNTTMLLGNTKDDHPVKFSSSQNIEAKLLQFYGDKINFHKGKTRQENLIFSKEEEALQSECIMRRKLKNKICNFFLALDLLIHEVEYKPFTEEIKLSDIVAGDVLIPEKVHQSFKYFIGGP